MLPFPKWLAVKMGFRHGGGSDFTSLARMLGAERNQPAWLKQMMNCFSESTRKQIQAYMQNLANEIGRVPPGGDHTAQVREIIRRMARGGVVAVATLEILINLYCLEKSGRQID